MQDARTEQKSCGDGGNVDARSADGVAANVHCANFFPPSPHVNAIGNEYADSGVIRNEEIIRGT